MWSRGLYCATSADSCAESATTATPQTMANVSSSGAGAWKRNPAIAQQVPLTIIAHAAIRAFPMRSANHPAAADPSAPLAIVAKATADPAGELGGAAERAAKPPRLAAANAAIQVHTA